MARPMLMNRRAATLTFGALWGALVIPDAAATQATTLTWTPKALTPVQARTLDVACELIIPKTDTPGAREAGVPAFVDRAVGTYCAPAEAKAIRAGLDRMEADARKDHGAAFTALKPEQQTALLAKYEAEARAPRPGAAATAVASVGRGESETGLSNRPAKPAAPVITPFFPALKDLVTVGYFTSKLGATKAVRYDPVPGAYRGCVPLSQIGRAWAT